MRSGFSNGHASISVSLPSDRCERVRDVIETLCVLEEVYNHYTHGICWFPGLPTTPMASVIGRTRNGICARLPPRHALCPQKIVCVSRRSKSTRRHTLRSSARERSCAQCRSTYPSMAHPWRRSWRWCKWARRRAEPSRRGRARRFRAARNRPLERSQLLRSANPRGSIEAHHRPFDAARKGSRDWALL